MHHEIVGTAMARMLNLADILELIVDRFDQRPFAQEQLISQIQDLAVHVLTQLGDQMHPVLHQELLSQGLGDVAFVAKEFAEEAANQAGNRPTVIDVPGCQAKGQQLTPVIDHQVELEAIEPAHRGFAPTGIHTKDPMLLDTGIAADRQRGGIDETDAGAGAELGV